jgi:hypothetical protein
VKSVPLPLKNQDGTDFVRTEQLTVHHDYETINDPSILPTSKRAGKMTSKEHVRPAKGRNGQNMWYALEHHAVILNCAWKTTLEKICLETQHKEKLSRYRHSSAKAERSIAPTNS